MAHFARKRFGQHFLTDLGVIERIVGSVDPRPGEHLVEIGPGRGAITGPLLARCGRMTVIELDRDLVVQLRRNPALDVVEADVLADDIAALASRGGAATPLRIVGNLPYNISTPILFHLLDSAAHVVDQHFMLQKEVVARMAAGPGSKTYGRLSVMLQWRYEIEALFDVPREAFEPAPRVDSAVVRMVPKAGTERIDAALLGTVVTVAFSQRRKLLRHTLGRWLDERGTSPPFDVQRRAEEVSVAEYLSLAAAIDPQDAK